jgi:glycosyltransferase involved in cell wall biosynthesis
MRLVVATSSFPAHSGEAVNAGVFVWALADALTALGHEIWVFTPDKGEPIEGFPIPVETFKWGGDEKVLTRLSPRHPLDLYRLGRLMVQGRLSLSRMVRRVDADAVLAMWAIPSGFWAAGCGSPFAVWVLGSDIWGLGKYPLGKQVVRKVLKSAGHVFADGQNLIDGIKNLTGLHAEFLASARRLPVDSTPPAQLPDGGPHFLFIGRWDRAKGPDVLLEAISLLRRDLPAARLHMFGGGMMEDLLRRRALQPDLLDAVHIHGYADPPTATAFLKACDVLVIPSRIESIPVIFSDALACSCPIVATTVGDLEKLITEHQVGTVCPPEDPEALSNAMSAVVAGEEPVRQRYQAQLARAASLFSTTHSAERCAEVLATLPRRTFRNGRSEV